MNSTLKMSLKPAVPTTGARKLPTDKKSSSGMKNALKKPSDLVLNAPPAVWHELLEEMSLLQSLLVQYQSTPTQAKRSKIETALYLSLAHLHVHSGAMLELDEETDA
jgi:hypothetical protein